MKKLHILIPVILLTAVSCKKDKSDPVMIDTVPALFLPTTNEADYGKNAPDFIVHANKSDNISSPWDLDFHPFRPNELWVINKGLESTGGNTVTISNAGSPDQTAEYRKDANSWHFMALPSALSFSKEYGTWCSTTEILDANRQGGSFTGPTLWSGDMNVYAKPTRGNGSHLDMLHGSPYCMGVEADVNNAFWVFDAENDCIAWYDFVADHGPGNSDHSDGKIHRYYDVPVTRYPDVPSHMVRDTAKRWLYIADPANKRVIRFDTKSGTKRSDLQLTNELLAEHWQMENEVWEVFADVNLDRPAGIEIIGNVLYVSDFQNGDIVAYSLETKEELARVNTGKPGIMGLKAHVDGTLWYVNSITDEVVSISPN